MTHDHDAWYTTPPGQDVTHYHRWCLRDHLSVSPVWHGGCAARRVRGEEVLWNRINRQEAAWGLGGKQRNRTGLTNNHYTDLNINRGFRKLIMPKLCIACCNTAFLLYCKTHSYVQLVVHQSDIFRNRVPRAAIFTADCCSDCGLCRVSRVQVSSWKETPEEIVAGGIKSWLGCEQECVQ